jgi:hypothetical protein
VHRHTAGQIVRADRPERESGGHDRLGQVNEEARHIRLVNGTLLKRVTATLQSGDDMLLGVEHGDSELTRGSGVLEPAEHLGHEFGARRIHEQREFTG